MPEVRERPIRFRADSQAMANPERPRRSQVSLTTVLARRGLRSSLAVGAGMGVVTALLVGLGLLLVPPIVTQGGRVAEMPAVWQKLQHTSWFGRSRSQVGSRGEGGSAER